jgi:hypothetical protein
MFKLWTWLVLVGVITCVGVRVIVPGHKATCVFEPVFSGFFDNLMLEFLHKLLILIVSFCGMIRMSVDTSDAVKSTVPPALAIPHAIACLMTLRTPDPTVCLLSDDGPGFVLDDFELAAYIRYKCMLSSLRMTRLHNGSSQSCFVNCVSERKPLLS